MPSVYEHKKRDGVKMFLIRAFFEGQPASRVVLYILSSVGLVHLGTKNGSQQTYFHCKL